MRFEITDPRLASQWLNSETGGSPSISPAAPDLQAAQPQMPGNSQGEGHGIVQDVLWNGVAGGVRDAAQETIDFGHSVANWFDDQMGDQFIPSENPFQLPEIAKAETLAGGLTRGVSQFTVGFIGAGKFLKAAGLASKMGTLARGLVQGGIADAVVIDPHEERLSNLLQEFPVLENPVTDFLSAKEDDSEAIGRFKNAMEGLALGAVTEPLFTAVRGLKMARAAVKAGDQETARSVLGATADEMEALAKGTPEGVLPEADKMVKPTLAPEAKPFVDGEALKQRIDPILRGEKTLADLDVENMRGVFNYERIGSADDVKAMVEEIGQAMKPVWDDGVVSMESVQQSARELAGTFGADYGRVLDQMVTDTQNLKEASVRLQATRMAVDGILTHVSDTGKLLQHNYNDRDAAKLVMQLELVGQLEASMKGVQKEFARGLGSMRIKTFGDIKAADADAIMEVVDRVGGQRKVRDFVAKLAKVDDPQAVVKIARRTGWGKAMDIHNEYWINAILSNPVTHAVNMTSNAINTMVMPMDRIVGGALTGDWDLVREGGRLYFGMARAIPEALRYTWKALMDGEGVLDPLVRKGGLPKRNISAQGLELEQGGALGHAVDFLGTIANLPSRALGTADELFKQITYRGKVYSDLYERALERGVGYGLDSSEAGKRIAEFIEQNAREFFDSQGAATSKSVLQFSREATFTQDLMKGTIPHTIQQATTRHPGLRIVIPFVKTPTNVIVSAVQHTPLLSYASAEFRAAMKEGGEKAAIAKGKLATGGMLWAATLTAAASGRITGGGPRNPDQRKVWLETNQPYSIKRADGTFYSYARLEPWSTILGLAADFSEVGGHLSDSEMSELATMMSTALARNLTSKTYLAGVLEAAKILYDPDTNVQKWAQRQAGSYVPLSGLAGNVRRSQDDALREVWTIMDGVKNRIPGLSEKLPPTYSWLTGEVITYPAGWGPDNFSPIVTVDKSGASFALKELARLGVGFAGPEKQLAGVKLTSEQYSELNRLTGSVRIGGKTLLQQLEATMEKKGYDLDRERIPDAPSSYDKDSHRVQAVRRIIEAYKAKAKTELLQQFPELKRTYVQEKRNQLWTRRGRIGQILNPQ